MSFWGELKRRNVVKVGAAYVIVGWLIVQVANTFFPILNLPAWAITLVAVLVILGFPLALLFAWAFELTPEGLKKTEHVPLEESITHITGQKLNYILVGVIVLALAYILVDKFYLDRRAAVTEVPTNVAEQAPAPADVKEAQKTIAVLPFVNRSPDPDQESFVDGLSEEIINYITQIKDLSVTSSTTCFAFKDSGKTIQEVAGLLGVAYILEGSVRKSGDELRITAQLIRAEDDVHLWSTSYDRELEDIFEIQEDIARAVADELKATFGIDGPRRKLGGTENVEAYELYLNALGQLHEATYDVTIRGLELLDAAIALDPKFANAWAQKAFFHTHLLLMEPAERSTFEQNESLSAARKAIELEPDLAAGHFQLGWVKTLTGDWIEAERAYSKALELTTDPFSYEVAPYSLHYFALGYFEKSQELIEKYLQKNPYHQAMRAFYMLNLYILGDTQGAEKEYHRSMAMFNDEWPWGIINSTFARLGTVNAVPPGKIPNMPISDRIWTMAKEHFESPEEGIEALRRAYSSSDDLMTFDFMQIALWAAYFGDSEFAMESMEKELRMNAVDFIFAWLPVMHEVRQLPRFKEFVKEFGLVDYWNEFGWPDICRPTDDGDFVCD